MQLSILALTEIGAHPRYGGYPSDSAECPVSGHHCRSKFKCGAITHIAFKIFLVNLGR